MVVLRLYRVSTGSVVVVVVDDVVVLDVDEVVVGSLVDAVAVVVGVVCVVCGMSWMLVVEYVTVVVFEPFPCPMQPEA